VWHFAHGAIDQKNNRFLPDTALAVESGTLNVLLENGSQMTVHGPSEVIIENSNEVRIPFGRLLVHADSEGFKVHTSKLDIVDLGTVFGVSASIGLPDEVHVEKGRVRANLKGLDLPPLELTTGQAARAKKDGTLEPTTFNVAQFHRSSPAPMLPDTLTVPVINDSFNDDVPGRPPAGWTVLSGPSTSVACVDDKSSSYRSILLNDQSSSSAASMSRKFDFPDGVSRLFVGFGFISHQVTDGGQSITLKDGTVTALSLRVENGYLNFLGSDGLNVPIAPITSGSNIDVKLFIQLGSKPLAADIYLGSTLAYEGCPIDAPSGKLNSLEFSTATEKKGDIRVSFLTINR
jgi:hypothetical protein